MESFCIKKTHRAEPQHTCGPTGAEKGPVYTYICILETEISRQPASCLLSGWQTVSGVSGWMEIISKTLLKHSSGWRSFIKNNKKKLFPKTTPLSTQVLLLGTCQSKRLNTYFRTFWSKVLHQSVYGDVVIKISSASQWVSSGRLSM